VSEDLLEDFDYVVRSNIVVKGFFAAAYGDYTEGFNC
jgi:hypothetical protein